MVLGPLVRCRLCPTGQLHEEYRAAVEKADFRCRTGPLRPSGDGPQHRARRERDRSEAGRIDSDSEEVVAADGDFEDRPELCGERAELDQR